jgi:hypothetical protein
VVDGGGGELVVDSGTCVVAVGGALVVVNATSGVATDVVVSLGSDVHAASRKATRRPVRTMARILIRLSASR